jgi:hypothetical protein
MVGGLRQLRLAANNFPELKNSAHPVRPLTARCRPPSDGPFAEYPRPLETNDPSQWPCRVAAKGSDRAEPIIITWIFALHAMT